MPDVNQANPSEQSVDYSSPASSVVIVSKEEEEDEVEEETVQEPDQRAEVGDDKRSG